MTDFLQIPQFLLATNNPGKAAEFRQLLAGCGWEMVPPSELWLEVRVEETCQACIASIACQF